MQLVPVPLLQPAARTRTRTALVASSDRSFRQRLSETLNGLRWQVREAASGAQAYRASRARRRAGRGGPGAAPLRRGSGHSGRDHVSRQGRVPRRSPAGAGRGGIHASRLRQLRLRPRGPDHRRRVRAAGVRPGADQPARRYQDHPPAPVPRRGGCALRRRRRPALRHRAQPDRARRCGRAAPGTVQAMVDRPLEIRQVFGS